MSFTAAAAELGVSQPAVSKSIKAVEESVGFILFERLHRGLSLTPKGAAFVRETQAAMHRLQTVLEELAPRQDVETVRVSFSTSFVAHWLLPRLPNFAAAHPEIMLRIQESVSETLDLAAEGLDFSARLGGGNWPGLQSTYLTPECIGAVASPKYLHARPWLLGPDSLVKADLINVDEPRRVRLGWRDWFSGLGITATNFRPTLFVSDRNSAIDAAIMGQGVALGWEHLVAGKIMSGELLWIGKERIRTEKSIFLVEQSGRVDAPHLKKFRNWIAQEFASPDAE